MKKQKKQTELKAEIHKDNFNKSLFVLAILAIIISIIGTVLIVHNFNRDKLVVFEGESSAIGSVSLNIISNNDEDASNPISTQGVISLNITNKTFENLEE